MRRGDRLNDRQVDVLRWVADGCPDGVMEGYSYKLTARALHDRRFVVVTRRRGGWQASITDEGRAFLIHGSCQPSESRRPSVDRRGARRRPATDAPSRPTAEERTEDVRAAAARQFAVSPAELMSMLEREGGTVTVADPDPHLRAAWRRTIDAVKRAGLEPEGQHLRHRGRDRGDLIIELRSGEHPVQQHARTRPPAVAVPQAVDALHPATAGEFTGISEQSQGRGQLLAHALAVAAAERGIDVGGPEGSYSLVFRRSGRQVGLHVYEEQEARNVLPDPDSLEAGPAYDWQRVQVEEREVPSGRLVMEFDGDAHSSGRRRRFADRQRWRLDDRLGDVLAEVEQRIEELRERQDARERADRERQQAWETAVAKARQEFHQSRRVAALDAQLDGWEKAQRIRAYCEALTAMHDDRDAQRAEWITWARSYADQLDPRGRADTGPAVVEPQPHELGPLLRGWSPYEAKRR